MAAALGCGALGGGLVGFGTLGFDGVPAGASIVCPADSVGPPSGSTSAPLDPTPAPTGADAPDREPRPLGAGMTAALPAAACETASEPADPAPTKKPAPAPDAQAPETTPKARPAPSGTPEPTGEATPAPNPETTPRPTAEATPEPTSETTPEPTSEPTSSPTVTATPTNTPSPTPTSAPVPTSTPVVVPAAPPLVRPVASPAAQTPVQQPNPPVQAPTTQGSQQPTSGQPTSGQPLPVYVPGVPTAVGTPIDRAQVIARAISWVAQGVQYSQTSWWTDTNGTYRQDCSGMVSMAWRLDQRSNFWTGNLGLVSHQISSDSLLPGDILLLPRSHTVIFAGWADAAHTRFNLYEEYATGRPARYAIDASLAYYLDRGFGAYRYNAISEIPVAGGASPAQAVGTDGGAATTMGLVAATSDAPGTPGSGGVQGVPWTPADAGAYVAETAVPSAPPDAITPAAVPDLPQSDLVRAQRALDEKVHLTADQSGHSGGYLVAAGLGLMFLAVPLGVGAKAGAWTRLK